MDRQTTIEAAFDRVRADLGVRTAFPEDVLQAADEAAARDPAAAPGRTDRTDIPFVTVDPLGSRDLDQALYLTREGDGFRLWYAIADVGFWVDSGSPIEREAWLRGETMYAPDRRDPLYPVSLSEGAASLLPNRLRPAILFSAVLDAQANVLSHAVERALVRSQARLTYRQVYQHVASGGQTFAGQPWADALVALKTFGERRREREGERGGVSLPILTQHVEQNAAARLGYVLEYEHPCIAEHWNAQVSLLTGHLAAQRMIDARVGLLRVLPPAQDEAVAKFRRVAQWLGFDWPSGMSYPDFMRSFDPSGPNAAVLVWQARRVMQGADYVAFDGEVPADPVHHALAMTYAHCTAPLRRLADRYVLDLLVELAAGSSPSAEERGRLPALAQVMNEADTRGSRLEREVVDIAEAWLLRDRIGEVFPATVLGVDDSRVEVEVASLPVRATLARGTNGRRLDLDERVRIRLTGVKADEGKTLFELVE